MRDSNNSKAEPKLLSRRVVRLLTPTLALIPSWRCRRKNKLQSAIRRLSADVDERLVLCRSVDELLPPDLSLEVAVVKTMLSESPAMSTDLRGSIRSFGDRVRLILGKWSQSTGGGCHTRSIETSSVAGIAGMKVILEENKVQARTKIWTISVHEVRVTVLLL
jgi:hypothetical protein